MLQKEKEKMRENKLHKTSAESNYLKNWQRYFEFKIERKK